MIEPDVFTVDPWSISEPTLRLDHLAETEAIFALSNGHIGLRGNLDEGEPHVESGSYLNGFFEAVPLSYAEAGYGYPEEGHSLVNVTNGKLFRLLVDDEPFDVRYGTLKRHERVLDLRAGVLRREVDWVSPAGKSVKIRSTRLVSFVQRAVAAICYEVEPVGASARITLQSSLVANEPMPPQSGDPRAAAALRSPLMSEYCAHANLRVELGHQTRRSGLRIAAALDHVYECPAPTTIDVESEPDLGRVTFSTELEPGQTLRVVKFLAYGWSSRRSSPALRDQVAAAVLAAKRTGWDGLLREQRDYLDTVWKCADVEVAGDPRLQQGLRYAIFQVVQAAARAEQQAIPAKGLTGRGYDGHSFWDMDTFLVSVLTYLAPLAARDALAWRHSTLNIARAHAQELKLGGAAFPWRTIRGEECSGYWPAGTAAFHINADIADAVRRYVWATGDTDFERDCGVELAVETARLWVSLGHFDGAGRFRIDGVTGPDEYTALVDNNVYTNLMAARNLRTAIEWSGQHRDRASELRVTADELVTWRAAAENMVIPYDSELGVTSQSEGFTRYRRWDFEQTAPDEYPLLLHYPYYLLYSSQVVKQADLVMALYLCGDAFDLEQKRRDFAFYEALTVRDSSLSAPIQAIVAAEVGQLDLAYGYFQETTFLDLQNLAGNTSKGVHLAALAGAWLVAVAGFGGMRDQGDVLAFAPKLPAQLHGLVFRLRYRGRHLRVEIQPGWARYELLDGPAVEIAHYGERLTLTEGAAQTRPYEAASAVEPVLPPCGCEPCKPGVGQDGNSSMPRVDRIQS